jgi:hypothetical protein
VQVPKKGRRKEKQKENIHLNYINVSFSHSYARDAYVLEGMLNYQRKDGREVGKQKENIHLNYINLMSVY